MLLSASLTTFVIVQHRYLNPYAYLPARPQTLSVDGLPDDQTVSIRKNVFRQFLEGDTAPVSGQYRLYFLGPRRQPDD